MEKKNNAITCSEIKLINTKTWWNKGGGFHMVGNKGLLYRGDMRWETRNANK